MIPVFPWPPLLVSPPSTATPPAAAARVHTPQAALRLQPPPPGPSPLPSYPPRLGPPPKRKRFYRSLGTDSYVHRQGAWTAYMLPVDTETYDDLLAEEVSRANAAAATSASAAAA